MSNNLSPEQLAGLIAKLSEPSGAERDLRERIKLAIQTAQDSEGRLLYIIPPGVAGMYADAVMRVLTERPFPYPTEPHSCESCPTCGVHDGRHDKCCGCYDGVCCQEPADPSSGGVS